jgi:hypothetical protein
VADTEWEGVTEKGDEPEVAVFETEPEVVVVL